MPRELIVHSAVPLRADGVFSVASTRSSHFMVGRRFRALLISFLVPDSLQGGRWSEQGDDITSSDIDGPKTRSMSRKLGLTRKTATTIPTDERHNRGRQVAEEPSLLETLDWMK